MLTKYILTIGGVEHDVPDECLKNWDEIAFSLKRTDYSGVMRSFSTEFVFVGEIKDLLWELYLSDGFKASASVAVYTITDTHTWVKQYEAALDFSTLECEEGTLSINALDNSLASLLKSKKSQKYEFLMDNLDTEDIMVNRVVMKNQAKWNFRNDTPVVTINGIYIDLRQDEGGMAVISKEYLEPRDESSGYDGTAMNRTIMMVNKTGVNPSLTFRGYVYHPFYPGEFSLNWNDNVPVAQMHAGYWDDQDADWHVQSVLVKNDISLIYRHGMSFNAIVGGDRTHVYSTLNALKAAAASETVFNFKFGIVGNQPFTDASYWEDNTVYEYQNGVWLEKGKPKNYSQWRYIEWYGGFDTSQLSPGYGIGIITTSAMKLRAGATLNADWNDVSRPSFTCRGITAETLINAIVNEISPGTEVSIVTDARFVDNTLLVPAEELRRLENAKVYCTFDNFCSWMEAVFGYTYRVNGDTLEFVHRSAVFLNTVAKEVGGFNEFSYEVNDNLIYSEVQAGYAKKDYGEISGRLEKNFTNYYSTELGLTDRKLQLISKFRADIYGIEYTAQKADSATKDDKADEDIFVLHYTVGGSGNYSYTCDNTVYAPSVCVENNKGFIAPMGNGAAVVLSMTSSDGDNALQDVSIAANTALFTAGELEFTTDDMELPSDLNALVQIDYNGHRYKGFIKEAECRFGRLNGVEYKLIVQDITAL